MSQDGGGKPEPRPRAAYRRFEALDTRWADNDVYGHVNNVQYYAFFDTAVNRMMIAAGLLDPQQGEVVALVVETRCSYRAPVRFPDRLQVGLKVLKLGGSSVRYELGLFRDGCDTAAAVGEFVHVYVDRKTHRPLPIPAPARAFLETLLDASHG